MRVVEVFPENLRVAQLVTNSLPFVKYKGSLSCSQEPATRSSPEPDDSSPHRHFNSYYTPIYV